MPPAPIEFAIGLVLVVVGLSAALLHLRRAEWTREPPLRWAAHWKAQPPDAYRSMTGSGGWPPKHRVPRRFRDWDARNAYQVIVFQRLLGNLAIAGVGVAFAVHALTRLFG